MDLKYKFGTLFWIFILFQTIKRVRETLCSANGQGSSHTNGAGSSSSEPKPAASDISHLIKRKRKSSESDADSSAPKRINTWIFSRISVQWTLLPSDRGYNCADTYRSSCESKESFYFVILFQIDFVVYFW